MKITKNDLKIGNKVIVKDTFSGNYVEIEIKNVDKKGDAYWVFGKTKRGKNYTIQFY